MPELDFQVEAAEPVALAAAPLLAFKLRISQRAASGPPAPIHAVVLRCQIRFEPAKRRYAAAEADRLRDLFGTPDRFSQTLRPMLWTHVSTVVPPFTSEVTIDMHVPCTFDFNVAATKYFYALEDGEVPLALLFSGTVFHEVEEAHLQVAQISWDKETSFRLPVRRLARDDGDLLSQQRVALAAQGRVRSALPVQEPTRRADLGASDRAAAGP